MNTVHIGPRMRATWLCVLALSSLACATGHSTERVGELTVHTFRRHYNNTHVIERGERLLMVDAGLEADAPSLAQDLRDAGLSPESLRAIVLTHGHADHAGGAHFFRDRFGTPIIAGFGDRALLAAGKNDHLCPTNGQAEDWVEEDQAATFTPFAADHWVHDQFDLRDITGIDGAVFGFPGHTRGSVVVQVSDVVLVGDLFRGAIVGSSAETHFYMCDLDDNRRDIKTLLEERAAAAQLFFVGHFGPVTRDAVIERFLTP